MKPARLGAIWTSCDFGSTGPEPCSRHCGGQVTRRSAITASLLLAALIALGGCTSSGGTDPSSVPPSSPGSSSISALSNPPTSSAPSSPTTTSSGTDPRGKAATRAYLAFVAASFNAERKPTDQSRIAAIKAHAVDPALVQEGEDLFQYRQSHIEWRGTPPSSRVSLGSVNFSGTYPTVTLVDCPTVSKTWRPYDTRTGKPLKLVPPKVAPPWPTNAKIIYYRGNWMVQTAKADMSRTCKP